MANNNYEIELDIGGVALSGVNIIRGGGGSGNYDSYIRFSASGELGNVSLSLLAAPVAATTVPTAFDYMLDAWANTDTDNGFYLKKEFIDYGTKKVDIDIPILNPIHYNEEMYVLWYAAKLSDVYIPPVSGVVSGVISFVNAPKQNSIYLGGQLVDVGGVPSVRYNLQFPEINNPTGSGYYPYRVEVRLNDQNNSPIIANDYIAGQNNVILDVPYYSSTARNATLISLYNRAKTWGPYTSLTTPLTMLLTPDDINVIISESNKKMAKTIDINSISFIDRWKIDQYTIDRYRLSVGLSDIKTIKNYYNNYGEYISEYFYVDDPIYTFTLQAKENIPTYDGVNPYDCVRYYVEFGNTNSWERITIGSRVGEKFEDGTMVPRTIVLDNISGDSDQVKYINYKEQIYTFRIRIVLDMTKVVGDFITPEIHNYKCIIFDKSSLVGR